jgi:pyruvate dehydrogenase E1 component alpha subunit
MVAMWKQGRGVGGTFSGRGHEAIAVGAGYAMENDDVVAPMHRDLACYLLRGLHPRRIMANLLGRATGVTAGRDANLHGLGDLDLNLIGFVSHLPQSMATAAGAAMAFLYRDEPRVALTFVGDGSSSTGLFHETLNLVAVQRAPLVTIVENNQYAYSTPLHQQMAVEDIAARGPAHGVPSMIVDGNDVEAVFAATAEAVGNARSGGGPSLIECKTMRMLGHAIHDGAEYVPRELLAEWESRDPVVTYRSRLVERGVAEEALEGIDEGCAVIVSDAVRFAEESDWPDPATVADGVYAG